LASVSGATGVVLEPTQSSNGSVHPSLEKTLLGQHHFEALRGGATQGVTDGKPNGTWSSNGRTLYFGETGRVGTANLGALLGQTHY